jgi:adenylate kinase family enzyme
MKTDDSLKKALSNVLWIGGPPDCGKTTIAGLLAKKYGIQVYHFDQFEMDHVRRADSILQPALFELKKILTTTNERAQLEWLWIQRTPAEMAKSTIASWTERIVFVVEDLMKLPKNSMIIAEGPGFFPKVVLPLIQSPRQAIWMAPSESFKRESYKRRKKGEFLSKILGDCEIAQQKHIERDLLISDYYKQAVHEQHLSSIDINGTKSVDEIVKKIDAYFRPLLR